jgi:hypothetical protein
MADPNPDLVMYQPEQYHGTPQAVSEPPRCEARTWRGEPCVLAIHEGKHIFLAPPPRLRDALSYWWLWLVDEFHELLEELRQWWVVRCL